MTTFTFNMDVTTPKQRLVTSLTNPNGTIPSPEFVFGENREVSVYLIAKNANGVMDYDSRSGSDDYALKVSIGNPGAAPTAGTFTLSFNAETTDVMAFSVSASEIQAALEGLSTIGEGNIQVSGTFPIYEVEFIGDLAETNVALITGDAQNLFPRSAIDIAVEIQGTAGTNEVQSIQLALEPVVFQDNWTQTDDGHGWTGTLNFDSAELLELFSVNAEYIRSLLELNIYDGSNKKTTAGNPEIKIYQTTATAATTGTVPANSVFGLKAIDSGVESVTVTALGLSVAPRAVIATVMKPADGFNLFATVDVDSITAAGFTAWFNGLTNSTDYKLAYLLVF